jgi:hypothetical protein
VLKSSRPISLLNVEIKTNVSEISSVSIIMADVVNDHTSLIYADITLKYMKTTYSPVLSH